VSFTQEFTSISLLHIKTQIMKKQLILLAISIISIGSFQANKITSRISGVTVYINGAQVYRKAKTTLKKGNNEIIIDDVSPYLTQKSIQASCQQALILDVKHNIEYNNPTFVSEPLPEKIIREINVLEDSLFYQNLQLEKLANQIYNLSQEKKIITNNKTIRGEGKSDSLAIFMQAVEFYHQKLEVIEGQLVALKISEHQLLRTQSKTQDDLDKLRNYSQHKTVQPAVKQQVHQIVLTVFSEIDIEAEFNVNYLVNRAGWIPSYDLRAAGSDQPVNLTYKASIYQKTGEDWDNVKLTLSTFNQECSFTIPTLATWEIMDKTKYNQNRSQAVLGYQSKNSDTISLIQNGYENINFYNTLSNTTMATSSATFNGAITTVGLNIGNSNDQFILPQSLVSNTDKTLSNVEFSIKNRYSIPADGKETMLVVKNVDLKSKFDYISVPKVNTDAFLLANITDWRDLNILPAKANIYFNNSFVGETEIRPSQMQDTLTLAMGREKAIEITRKKIEDEAKDKLASSNVKREITIEIAVKNTNSITSEIAIKDQIPVSKDDNIKVKQIDLANGRLNELTGILTWNLKLRPNETKIIKFTYEITHDKEIEVI
jgi:hypothetical protein